jgi:acetylornithine deacetylase/succinyl-diaminopimelate desuccinylase family protein
MDLNAHEKEVLNFINPEEVVEFLQSLIQNRSDFPPGDCRLAIQVVADKLKTAGVHLKPFTRQELQPNLLAAFPSDGAGKCLMLHAHIDTVPAGERERWRFDPFSGTISDGKIFGRGAGDDKSSVAVQVMALISLARAGVQLDGSLQVVIVSDEESGGLNGTKWLHDEGILTSDALIVGEQTDNQVAIAERVACGIDLTVSGKSAHGAMPWAGENAVLKTAGALQWLRSDLFPRLQERNHPYLPPPTLNIGRIQGGIQWSIVPERCKVEMDRRLLPGENRETAVEEIRASLDDYSRHVEPLNYELYSSGEVANNINTPPDDPFVTMANKTLFDLCRQDRALTGYAQTSDGRWFANDDIPIIIFGPSKPEVAHAADEYVTVNQLIEATQFLTLFALRWLGTK